MTINFCLLRILVFIREFRVNLLTHFHLPHVPKVACSVFLLIKITILAVIKYF